jgi:glycosyltransferase involved in cell wall biosynthesis
MQVSQVKKVLYFFPLNPADNNTGSCRRALGILQYFKDRNISVDFVSKHDWGKWTSESKKAFEDMELADNLYIFKRKPDKKNPVSYFFNYKLWHNLHEQKLSKQKSSFPNHTTLYLQQQFDELFSQNNYDLIILSYAYWADIIHNNPFVQNSITILDTHDFLTSQHQLDPHFNIGVSFGDEIKRLSYFDQVWAIAPEEQYVFAQFLEEKVQYIPAWINDPGTSSYSKKFDLVYVATDNPHNLRSAKWFFSEVYPLLDNSISIVVIGKINDHLANNLPNVKQLKYVDSLNDYYARSKVALCPMLSGTGVKIKVIEAMAHGLAVVCNDRGLDGLPVKVNNGCLSTQDAQEFANNIHRLLNDPQFYSQQSQLARNCYEVCFTREVGYNKIDIALQQATSLKSLATF